MRPFLSALLILATALPAAAQNTCADPARVAARTAELAENYSGVLSDISCDAPAVPAHEILCDDYNLWEMSKLDTFAYVYAYENATGQETDHTAPPVDEYFIAERDACTDAACLCDLLKAHTNDSLGGTSPYTQ